ncbi:MAG: hypothetical protein AB1631_14940 [Acidobacteriota bacterium]
MVAAQGEQLIGREQTQVSNSFESRKVAELLPNAAAGGIDILALLAPDVIPGSARITSPQMAMTTTTSQSMARNSSSPSRQMASLLNTVAVRAGSTTSRLQERQPASV